MKRTILVLVLALIPSALAAQGAPQDPRAKAVEARFALYRAAYSDAYQSAVRAMAEGLATGYARTMRELAESEVATNERLADLQRKEAALRAAKAELAKAEAEKKEKEKAEAARKENKDAPAKKAVEKKAPAKKAGAK